MTKRIIALLTVLMMLLAGVSLAEENTYTGTAKGFAGDVKVTLTIKDNVITACTAEGANETQGIGSEALENLPKEIVETNSINVDVFSSATVTSNAIIEAAMAALVAGGLNPADYSKVVDETSKDMTYDTDIVIVGAGGAGMVSAMVAADQGKKVIIVESMPIVGGNSVRATGGMNACETENQQQNTFAENAGVEKMLNNAKTKYAEDDYIQQLAQKVSEEYEAFKAKAEGYFDSVALMELDALIGGLSQNDHDLVHVLANDAAAGVQWLKDNGISLEGVGSFGGASVKRIHRPLNDEGKTIPVGSYMIPRLEENCTSRGVQFLLETTAQSILMVDGVAKGIVATGENGEKITINAKAVILASGGFGANEDMVVQYKPELAGFMTTNAGGIQGQGIQMALEAGADTTDMDQIQIHPTVQYDTSALITEGLRGDGAILVNADGKRFADEVGTRDVVSAAEIAQPGSYAYLVIDQKMVDKSAVIAGYIKKGFTVTGNDYSELAKAMGVDETALNETMTAWNTCVQNKEDKEFGRTSFANPLDTAPYYAIKVSPGVHHTMGGVKINTNTEVISVDGKVIPGLFAAGEITGGVHGANRLGGNAVSDFVVFGRIAGEQSAQYVK